MMIQTIRLKNYQTQIVRELGARIVGGAYEEGARIPVEENLAEEFGVSRPIVREATKILSSKGLLTAKPKVGTMVLPRARWNLLDEDVLNWMIEFNQSREFLDKLFEVRSAIEPKAAALAAQNAQPDDLERIFNAWQDMSEVEALQDSFEPDLRFHFAIFTASNNEFMQFIGRSLYKALVYSFQLTTWNEDLYHEAVKLHYKVYLAIKGANAKRAENAMLKLLLSSREDFDLKN